MERLTLEKEENLMQVIHGTERPEFLLEDSSDVQKAVDALRKLGESVAVFFHANGCESRIGCVMVDDSTEVIKMAGKISRRLQHKNDPLRVRAGECMT